MKRIENFEKGEFSKTVVIYCIKWMTAVLVWAMVLTSISTFIDKTVYISDVLSFASAFFGGELCLLALKRILAKERTNTEEEQDETDRPDADYRGDDSACSSTDYSICYSADQIPCGTEEAGET